MSCNLKDWLKRRLGFSGVAGFALLFVLVIPLASVHSYDEWGGDTWDGDPTLRIYSLSFPSGSVWLSDLQNGLERWNDVWGMWLEFDTTTRADATWQSGDDVNGVGFSLPADIGGAWGMTYKITDGGEIVEMDVRFNVQLAWRTGAQDERTRNTANPAFRKVVVHELGHALGLNHFCSELAQMAQGYAGHVWYGGSASTRHHPTPDDVEGSRALYPWPSTTARDAALSNFEMLGACNSQVWRNNAALTTVQAGSVVDVEYSVANPGNVGISFSLGLYLSTNDYISKYDTFLAGESWWITDQWNSERDRTVTIPCNVSLGTYFMGVVVDPDDEVSEVREGNNRLVFPGRWQIVASTELPDLVVTFLSHRPQTPRTNQTAAFTALVKNIGCGAAGASKLELRVGGETVGQIFSVPPLSPGQTFNVQRQEQLDVAQNYMNTATADYGNDLNESNEGNNKRTDTYTVVNP